MRETEAVPGLPSWATKPEEVIALQRDRIIYLKVVLRELVLISRFLGPTDNPLLSVAFEKALAVAEEALVVDQERDGLGAIFHKLWTVGVGQPRYDKMAWKRMELLLHKRGVKT